MEFKITGNIKKVKHALIDYIAEGYIERGGERIPCEIGFTIWGYSGRPDDRQEAEIEASYIFINNGITANGTHYTAETIRI